MSTAVDSTSISSSVSQRQEDQHSEIPNHLFFQYPDALVRQWNSNTGGYSDSDTDFYTSEDEFTSYTARFANKKKAPKTSLQVFAEATTVRSPLEVPPKVNASSYNNNKNEEFVNNINLHDGCVLNVNSRDSMVKSNSAENVIIKENIPYRRTSVQEGLHTCVHEMNNDGVYEDDNFFEAIPGRPSLHRIVGDDYYYDEEVATIPSTEPSSNCRHQNQAREPAVLVSQESFGAGVESGHHQHHHHHHQENDTQQFQEIPEEAEVSKFQGVPVEKNDENVKVTCFQGLFQFVTRSKSKKITSRDIGRDSYSRNGKLSDSIDSNGGLISSVSDHRYKHIYLENDGPFGFLLQNFGEKVIVIHVENQSASANAGVCFLDEIIMVNNIEVTTCEAAIELMHTNPVCLLTLKVNCFLKVHTIKKRSSFEKMGLSLNKNQIINVDPKGSAYKNGLRAKSLIVNIDGNETFQRPTPCFLGQLMLKRFGKTNSEYCEVTTICAKEFMKISDEVSHNKLNRAASQLHQKSVQRRTYERTTV
eukprot:Awhi_evm1s14284